MCLNRLNFEEIERAFQIDVPTYFQDALQALEPLMQDGLLERHAAGLEFTPLGRMFSRNIAMPFDAYLPAPVSGQASRFSRTL
jgi:oxygen-independent coproporphyrinogen III oxidase